MGVSGRRFARSTCRSRTVSARSVSRGASAPAARHGGGVVGDLHGRDRCLHRRHRDADDRLGSRRLSPVQLGFCRILLAQAVTIPIYGRLADLYGRKRVFFAGTSLFLLGSALCGLAWGMLPLVLFRALEGIGAGAIQPIATTIVGDIYTPVER